VTIVEDLGRGVGKMAGDLAIVEYLEIGGVLKGGEVLELGDVCAMGEPI
jgi:hypothetical protein